MNKYLTDLHNGVRSTNKLQRAVEIYLQKRDRRVIPQEEYPHVWETIRYDIERINVEHSKCTPLKLSEYGGSKSDREIYIDDGKNYHIQLSFQSYQE